MENQIDRRLRGSRIEPLRIERHGNKLSQRLEEISGKASWDADF